MLTKILKSIKGDIRRAEILTSSGGAGPGGFGQVVYDFIKVNIDKAEGDNNLFFLWHPDTTWRGAFHRLNEEDPLPASFIAESNDLDEVCERMMAARQDTTSNTVFHLLIPSWYDITSKEPLHFPDELLPLHVVGPKHDGRALVTLNLPAAQQGLLHGIANVQYPRWKKSVAAVARITAAPASSRAEYAGLASSAAVGVFVGSLTGAWGLPVAFIWLAYEATKATASTMDRLLSVESARILGSTEVLDAGEGHDKVLSKL